MPPFTKAHIRTSNGFEPYPAPVRRENIIISTMNDAEKPRSIIEGGHMRRVTDANPQKRVLTEIERSKFTQEMRGEKGRCEPCFKGKGGAVYSLNQSG